MNEYSFVGHGPIMHGSTPLHMVLITPLLVMDECIPLTWSGRLQSSKQYCHMHYRINARQHPTPNKVV